MDSLHPPKIRVEHNGHWPRMGNNIDHRDNRVGMISILKAQGHVTVNKPVTSRIYIVSRTWPLCAAQNLVDGVNPPETCFQKSTNISPIGQHMSVSFVSLQSSRVRLQNSTVILRNIVEDLGDTACQKYCKIVISKEVCLPFKADSMYF